MQINNISETSNNTSNDQSIVDQYDQYFLDVMNGKPDATQKLSQFLSDPSHYQAVLKAMNDIGYAPSPNDQDPAADLKDLVAALKLSIPDAISEFGQDVNIWMGMNCVKQNDKFIESPITPDEISHVFDQVMKSFQENPSLNSARGIEWLLHSSYAKALSQCTKDPNTFLKMANQVEIAANNYTAQPSADNLKELQEVLANLPPLSPQ